MKKQASGDNPTDICNLPTSDAGKKCSGSNDCEGDCLADLNVAEEEIANSLGLKNTGKCSAYLLNVGCLAYVEDGWVNGIMCSD